MTSHSQSQRPLIAKKSPPLKGRLTVPGDKSISHRSLLLGGLAIGKTTVEGLLESTDIIATANALRAMGVPVTNNQDTWEILGRGIGGLVKPNQDLDFGNSGTGVRLMMGILAGLDFSARLVGDESLSKRPMGRVLTPLKAMGLHISEGIDDRLPLTIDGTSDLIATEYELPVASAQVKSAILFAGLHTMGRTTVIEREATRDHTERMLRFFGANVQSVEKDGARHISVEGEADLQGQHVKVPGDPSSAAFLVAAALLVKGSEITIENVLTNPTRTGLFQTLIEMGADIRFENERTEAGEPVADIIVKHSPLTGVTVPADRAPSMIDEYPMLAALSTLAQGETRMNGLAELRVKESDRLAATAAGIEACGATCAIEGDTLIVSGQPTVAGGGPIITHMDHRIAMSFLVLGLATQNPVTVDDGTMIATSFPSFTKLMGDLGADISETGEPKS